MEQIHEYARRELEKPEGQRVPLGDPEQFFLEVPNQNLAKSCGVKLLTLLMYATLKICVPIDFRYSQSGRAVEILFVQDGVC